MAGSGTMTVDVNKARRPKKEIAPPERMERPTTRGVRSRPDKPPKGNGGK